MRRFLKPALLVFGLLGVSIIATAATQQSVGPDFQGPPSVPSLTFKVDGGSTVALAVAQAGQCTLDGGASGAASCVVTMPGASATSVVVANLQSNLGGACAAVPAANSVTITCVNEAPADAGTVSFIRMN